VEATCSKIGTVTFHGRDASEASLTIGEGAYWVKVERWKGCTGDARKVARERVLSIKFYGSSLSRGKLVYGSSGMSNGCCGIACRFTHQANFPAYRGAIFLPPSLLFPSGASSLCSYFTFPSPFPPQILHPVFVSLRTTASPSHVWIKAHFLART